MIISSYNIAGGLASKMGIICEMIEERKMDILLVSEAECRNAPKIVNFQAFTENSESFQMKRVIMYVRDGIKATQIGIRTESSVPMIAMKLATCTVIGIYNQHTQNAYTREARKLSKKQMFNQFMVAVQDALKQCRTKRIVLMGDVNMNWQVNEEGIKDWAAMMNLNQVIKKPTRMRSILDHIYVRGIEPVGVNVTEYGLSDHNGVEIKFGKTSAHKKEISFLKLAADNINGIELVPRSFIDVESDLSDMIQELHGIQESLRITKTIKIGGPPKWVKNTELAELRREIVKGADEQKLTLRAKYRLVARKLAREDIQAKINKNRAKNVWSVVKEHKNGDIALKDGNTGEWATEHKQLAEMFKKEFMRRNTPERATEHSIPELVSTAKAALQAGKLWSFNFVTPLEVQQVLAALKNTSLAGPDRLQTNFMKAIKMKSSENIAQLFNMMIANSSYPNQLVTGRTIPVYKGKKKDRAKMSSYREVTTVSVLGKVIEKLLLRQLVNRVSGLMPNNIFGYVKGKSTDGAINHLIRPGKKGQPRVLVMTDANNAFPSLDHSLIIGMLNAFGASTKVQEIMNKYLKGRAQFVQVGRVKTEIWWPKDGIFAGAVLSGMLWNVGTTSQVLERPGMAKFADDNGSMVESSRSSIVAATRNEIQAQYAWYERANLKPATGKTEVLPIGCVLDDIEVKGEIIKPAKSITFLGAIIQSDLKFGLMINEKKSRLVSAAWWMRSMWYLHVEQKVMICKALVHGVVFSNAEVYLPYATAKQMSTLQIAANIAFRAAMGLKSKGKANLQRRRKKWGVTNIKQIAQFIAARAAFKNSERIRELHQQQQDSAGMSTRRSHVVKVVRHMDPFLADQVKAWNLMDDATKKANVFPRRKIWRGILGINHRGRPPELQFRTELCKVRKFENASE